MQKKVDLIVVGAGVLGVFHAYHALKAGLSVILLEKDQVSSGATVRNFGQVVPSGMDQKWQRFGRESLKMYKEIQAEFDISVEHHGSIYLASDQDELQLLHELAEINRQNDYPSELLSAEACIARYPGLRQDYCKGGLFFPEEITVDPRALIHRLLQYIVTKFQLDFRPLTPVISVESDDTNCKVRTANGDELFGEKVIICNGSDFKILFPSVFYESDIEVSKLQMFTTMAQPSYYKLHGSILTGLTIRRYESFRECPSYSSIHSSHLDPRLKAWGIHILFKQAADGSIILGDSHHYQDARDIDKLGFDNHVEVNDLILAEARKIFNLPVWEIQDVWYGIYSQCKGKDIFQHTIDNKIHIVTGIGGKGMTGSGGFAQSHIGEIFQLANN